ncbi:hypothetical protein Tco_0583576 [Tanacetum coccineum]
MNIINDKVAKLDADLLEMALHLEEKFYPHLLTTISGRRWLLTRGLKLAVVKCLNFAALGSAISRVIENRMQSGLSVRIDHRKAGRSLADVVAYNLAAEADYNAALPLADAPEMSNLQHDIEQLTLSIHRSEDQAVLGETSLSFALSTPASVPATVLTTTALSTTFASTSYIPPITVDDYEIVSVDGQEDTQETFREMLREMLLFSPRLNLRKRS